MGTRCRPSLPRRHQATFNGEEFASWQSLRQVDLPTGNQGRYDSTPYGEPVSGFPEEADRVKREICNAREVFHGNTRVLCSGQNVVGRRHASGPCFCEGL